MALPVWTSPMLLPGCPRLEARLIATALGPAPFSADLPPGRHRLRGVGLLREAGLVEARTRALVGEGQAPPTGPVRAALAALAALRRPGAEDELSREGTAELRRLPDPGST